MHPTTVFCPNLACPARVNWPGNMASVPSGETVDLSRVLETFTTTTGTAFYRLRTSSETVTRVVTLMAHGCPLQAIVVAFGFDERTVADWLRRAGVQSQAVQAYMVEQPRALGQVQADEIRVRTGWNRVDGAGDDGQHPLVAGWRSQRAAGHEADLASDRAGARRCPTAPDAVLY